MTGGANSFSSKGLALGKQHTGPLKFNNPLNLGSANGLQKSGDGPLWKQPDFGPRGNGRPTLPKLDQNKIADLLKNSKLQPMQPNFGLDDIGGGAAGGAGNGGGNNGDAADPDQGAGGQADPNAEDENPHDGTVPFPHDPHDDDCHHDHDHDHDCPFPWWPPVIIGGGGHYCPPAHITVVEQPIVVQTIPASIDLQIVDVRIVDFGDAAHNRGPRYRIVFTNVGTVATGNFQLMAMASLDGTPKPAAPAATAEVVTLAPGEFASVDVRLPLTADLSTMGALIVVIDSAIEITETDEQNNVLVLDRAKIATAEAVVAVKQ
jgi:hypothetical protein